MKSIKFENSIIFLLGSIFIWIIGASYATWYFPGVEDIALISQSQLMSVEQWFSVGYRDWFETNSDVITQTMYEKRPATHLYAYLASFFIGNNFSIYGYLLPFFYAIAFGSFIFLMSELKLKLFQKVIASLVFLVFNPCLTFEIFVDFSFVQVSLGLAAFCMLGVFLIRKNIYWIISILIFCAILKESTFYYGALASFVWFVINKGSARQSLIIAISYYLPFALLHIGFQHEELTSALTVFKEDTSIYEKAYMATQELLASLVYIPVFISFDSLEGFGAHLIIVMLLVNLVFIGVVIKSTLFDHKALEIKIVGMMFLASLLSFLVFHSELRWGLEFSACFSICLSMFLVRKRKYFVVGILPMSVFWLYAGYDNTLNNIYESGKKELGAQSDLIIYGAYFDMLRAANDAGAEIVYVVNDPTGVNIKYVNHMTGINIDVVRASEIRLKKPSIFSSVAISEGNGEILVESKADGEYAVFEGINAERVLQNKVDLNGIRYDFEKNNGVFNIGMRITSKKSSYAIAYFDTDDLTYHLYMVDGKKIGAEKKSFTYYNRSKYSYSRYSDVSCRALDDSNVDVIFFDSNEEVYPDKAIIKMTNEEGKCLIDFNKKSVLEYGVEIVDFVKNNEVIERIQFSR